MCRNKKTDSFSSDQHGVLVVLLWGQDGDKKWITLVVLWIGVGYTFNQVGNSGNPVERGEYERAMFIGEYTHTVDEKKRFSLPAKFRKELGRKVVVTRGKDFCLSLYPHKTWVAISEEVKKLGHVESDHRYARFTFSGASEIEIDSIGRILIPEFLREFADLPTGRQASKNSVVVITGVHDKVEIWNDKRWAAYRKKLESEYA